VNDTTSPPSPAELVAGAVFRSAEASFWAERNLLPTRQDHRCSPRDARTDPAAAPAPACEQIVDSAAKVGFGVGTFLRDSAQVDAASRDCADLASRGTGGARHTFAFFARAARQTTLHTPASQGRALEAPFNAVDEPDGR
jgi:hypothetical protein